MFEHLDDPNPPPPRQLLVELVVAEGARRRRRRAALAGGMAATLLVLAGSVRLAQLAGSDADVQIQTPQNSSSDSRGEGGESDDDVSTATDPSDAVTTPPDGEASAPPGTTPPGTTPPESTFAALTGDGLVVLADLDLDGRVSRELVDASANDMQLGTQVALSPDRQTVYFSATPSTGDEAGESAIFKVSTTSGEEPELVDTGSSPAVSPDGSQLAYVQNGAQIVVRTLATGAEQNFVGSPGPDLALDDLAFTSDGEALVFTAAPPDGPAALYLLDLTFSMSVSASLNDAGKLGPTDAAPLGTAWSSPDARDTDDTVGVVASCCAPTGDSGTSFVFVDPTTGQQPTDVPVEDVTGTVLQASYDSSGQNQLVLTVDGDGGSTTYSLYLAQDGPLQRLDQAGQYTAIDW